MLTRLVRRTLAAAILLLLPACSSHSQQTQGVVIIGQARFTVIAPECIRIEYSGDGRFIDEPSLFAINRGARHAGYRVTRHAGRTEIDTGNIRLTYLDDGTPFGPHNLIAAIRHGRSSTTWVPGKENEGNLGGTLPGLEGVTGPVDLGEGLLSRSGWYLLDDSRQPLLTDDWVAARPEDAGTDWYLFGYGSDYKSALRALTAIGGAVPMPRKPALGVWFSRFWPHTSDDYREIVKEYDEHTFPLDVVVMDMDWHDGGWTGWSWNRKLLPDAEMLLDWLHDRRLDVVLNVHPAGGVAPNETMYEAFMRDMGEDPAAGATIPFDAANKKYLDTLFRHTHTPLEQAGVDFWWLDWQQEQATAGIPSLTNQAWLNDYYHRHTERGDVRGMGMSRWGGWGDHRNVIHFSGDAESRWSVLRFQVPFTTTAANVGCFFWSHDIGGHQGVRDAETYTRWVQFGALSAALRPHSSRGVEFDRRPWTYGRQAEEAMRRAFHLRSELLPYIYSSVRQSSDESVPLLRSMYLQHPEDGRAYANAQQYYFGDAFLAAPIVSPGEGSRKLALQAVWFPEGAWYNWFTGERYEGNLETVVAAELDEIPLYVKEGVPIPMQPYTSRMTTDPLERLVIRCYPGQPGRFVLYEDDGVTRSYERGAYATTELTCARREGLVTVSVGPTRGDYDGRPARRSFVIELAGTGRARAASIDGSPAPVEYDETLAVNRILVTEREVERGVTVEAEVSNVDFKELRDRASARRLEGVLGDTRLNAVDDPALLGVALGALGVNVQRKNEGVYLHRGDDVLLVTDTFDLLQGPFRLMVEDRAGPRVEPVLQREGIVQNTLRLTLPKFPVVDSTLVGFPWIRTARLDFVMDGREMSLSREIERRPSALRRWNIAGPFPYTGKETISAQAYGPETESLDLDRRYTLADGQTIGWQSAAAGDDGAIDLRAAYDYSYRLAYGLTFLEADREQEAIFRVSSDDAVELWLNGKKLHSNDVARPLGAAPDQVAATLRKGTNALLLKVANGLAEWAFRVELESRWPVQEQAR